MKKLALILLLAVPLMGCKPASTTTTPQTLAPGYANSADQAMGETLVAAHAFYTTIQGDVTSGKYTPSATEKTSLNNFATALNSAQIIYIAYHAGQSTQAQAQAAVNAVTAQQASLQSSLSGGTK
jgi:hypothetical protein